MKITIFGAGQLGTYLKKKGFGDHEVVLYPHEQLDITDIGSYPEILEESDVIINCAAFTNVDKAEGANAIKAYSVNALAVMSIVMNIMNMGKTFIHVSSEVVYGSNDPLYLPLKEDAPKDPQNTYSQSKLQADEFIEGMQEMIGNWLILRPGWLFGPDNDHNFISKISSKILSSEDPPSVVTSEIGSLASVDLMWKVMNEYIGKKLPSGIYNVANTGYASRWEIAKFIHDQIAPDKPDPVKVDIFERPVKIAKNSCLDCTKLRTALPELKIPTWKEDVLDLMIKKEK